MARGEREAPAASLKQIRRDLGLTQVAFAGRLGLSERQYRRWETGRKRWRPWMDRFVAWAVGEITRKNANA